MLPITAPGNSIEPPDDGCDECGGECECREYYIEEREW